MLRQFATLACLMIVTGCSAGPMGAPVGAVAPAELRVSASLDLSGPSGYQLQALMAYTRADIHHVVLTLYKNEGGGFVATGAGRTVANADLASAIALGNLKLATSYKVLARAYADAAETVAIDEVESKGSDAACSVTFTTPAVATSAGGDSVNDAALSISVPVRLKNKTYAGTANSLGVAVTNGTIVSTTAAETF